MNKLLKKMSDKCDFYCLSFKNPERKSAMEHRFQKLGVDAFIHLGVGFDDERIAGRDLHDHSKRCWSFTYGHFDLIREFYFTSEKEYGIFCEDDIFIRKDFIQQLPKIIENFESMNLDLLLLGYLTPYTIDENYPGTHLKKQASDSSHPFSYYSFSDSIWGAQMYMLSKAQAGFLLSKYSPPYADLSINNSSMKPFNSDWTITKEGNRALIYPMIALEDGKTQYDDISQYILHQECHHTNYIKDLFYE
jgi:hypothetical protein